ncbi:MAG TPA: cell division protein ZapA [archaeon]|nr:cell division protein ZapA [archaeon]
MMSDEELTEVQIFGERYTLRATDSPEYLNRVAEYVDTKFHEVAKESPALTPVKVAVLASLNIADDLFKRDEAKDRIQRELLARIDGIFQLLQHGGVTG